MNSRALLWGQGIREKQKDKSISNLITSSSFNATILSMGECSGCRKTLYHEYVVSENPLSALAQDLKTHRVDYWHAPLGTKWAPQPSKESWLVCYSISQSVSQSVSPSVSPSVSQSGSQSVSQSVRQSVSQSANQSISQSVNQSFIHSVSLPVSQSINQPISQSVSQLINQLTNESVRYSASQRCKPSCQSVR